VQQLRLRLGENRGRANAAPAARQRGALLSFMTQLRTMGTVFTLAVPLVVAIASTVVVSRPPPILHAVHFD
jgi:hypothetical protein